MPLSARFSAICLEMALEEQERRSENTSENSSASLTLSKDLRVDLIIERIGFIAAEALERPDDREYFLKKIWWLTTLATDALLRREIATFLATESALNDSPPDLKNHSQVTSNRVHCLVRILKALDEAKMVPDKVIEEKDMTNIGIAFIEGKF